MSSSSSGRSSSPPRSTPRPRRRWPAASASSRSSTSHASRRWPGDAGPAAGAGRGRHSIDVTFAYEPGRPVLHDVSFKVEPGQTRRPRRPDRGGQDDDRQPDPALLRDRIRRYPDRRPRRAVGLPRQPPPPDRHRPPRALPLHRHDRRKHRLRARRARRQAEIEAAARAVDAHDFIERLPDGYDTELGEAGGALSEGQRQLLSFARAILADPRILILDEATSRIDTRTEPRSSWLWQPSCRAARAS